MNKSWIYKKIGEVCTVERGGSPRPIDQFITDDEKGINWIKIGDTTDSMYITKTEQKIIPEGMKKSRYVKPGDFLLSNSMSFGRPYILQIDGCIHDGWLVLRDDKEMFDKRFLYYYLSSRTTYEKFKSMAVGGVVNNLNSEMVRNVDVPIPEKNAQTQVADLLDKMKGIIDNRKKELLLLDTLIKARFVEMFGDPADSSNMNSVELSEICNKITDGEHGSVAKVPNGHPFLNAKHIMKNGRIDWDTITFIGDEDHQRIYRRCNPEEGDILLTTTGTIGNVAIMPKHEEVSMDRGITLLKINRQRVTSEFVAEMLKQPAVQTEMGANVHASAIGHLFMNKVKKLPAIVPSMDEQVEFTDFVKQVDKSKVAIQKSLEKTRLLFDSLMQKYFG